MEEQDERRSRSGEQQQQQQQSAPAARALAVGAKVIDRATSPLLTYQSALDVLQELVNTLGDAYVPQMVPMHHSPMPIRCPMPMPMPMPHPGYSRPLPFPNFVPANGYHEPNGHAHPARTRIAPTLLAQPAAWVPVARCNVYTGFSVASFADSRYS